MKLKKFLCILVCVVMLVGCLSALSACAEQKTVLMLWGPEEHRDIWLKYAEEFAALHPEEFANVKFEYAGSGDAGAWASMSVDPSKGAAIYSFPNDQMANLANINALSPLVASDLEWARENNIAASVEAGKLGDKYLAYPLQADNGFYMYYRKDVFEGTSIWDATTGDLKEGYTFQDMYKAMDEKDTDLNKNGKITWAMGDGWYVSGVFFATGGDYEVIYDEEGKQKGADCWFAYTEDNKKDLSIGLNAVECMKNTFWTNGAINKHFFYTDNDKSPLFDYVDIYTNPDEKQGSATEGTPFVGIVCGTWKAAVLAKNWGENLCATKLPMLEDDQGRKYAWKTFAGYKMMGVNPMCEFAQANDTNIELLHQLAQYLTNKESQIARYELSGAGPSNAEALETEAIKNDKSLVALNAQYDRVCVYPEGHEKAGQPVGNGLGYRVQDSVPANYWTPIQNFAQTMWQEYYNEGKGTPAFKSFNSVIDEDGKEIGEILRTLRTLQNEIAQAAQ